MLYANIFIVPLHLYMLFLFAKIFLRSIQYVTCFGKTCPNVDFLIFLFFSPADSLMCQEQRHEVSERSQVASSNNKQNCSHIPHHFALIDVEKSLPLRLGFNVSAYQTMLRDTPPIVPSPALSLLDAFSTLNISWSFSALQECIAMLRVRRLTAV